MKTSINGCYWQLKPSYNTEKIVNQCGISDFLARIISSENNDIDQIINYLDPKIKNLLPDPFHLLDISKGVARVIKAIKNKEKICIFADYDVDGATSAAILKRLFRDLNYDADIYVPNRILEGYGPTSAAFNKLKADYSLIITVDCGASAHEALNHASTLGLCVVVIDHHLSDETLPIAAAIINPNRFDERSRYGYLAAVGVTFLFGIALISVLKKEDFFDNVLIPNLMNYLDLVALGTVCDVMPLVGLNRAFVTQGLKLMNKRQNQGIKALSDIGRIDEKITSYHLGFVIGPRINAGGRVGRSDLGANLLATDNVAEAMSLALELDRHNSERKILSDICLSQASAIAATKTDQNVIIIAGQNWHEGIIGIIAARIKDKYNKPVAVIAISGDIAKASARSALGFDFGKAILMAKEKNIVISGGGHKSAAGFSIEVDKIQDLESFLNKKFDESNLSIANKVYYHADLSLESLNLNLINELSCLEPYGNGNSEPIFKLSDLKIIRTDILAEKHLKCLFISAKAKQSIVNAIIFNAVDTDIGNFLLKANGRGFAAIGTIKLNIWQDKKTIQFYIKDIIIQNP